MVSQYNEFEADAVKVGRPGNLGRIRTVTEGGCQLNVEVRGGQFVTATWDRPFELAVGDVVILHEGAVERVRSELWVEESWVGVVKVKLDDVTVVDGGGRWRLVPTNAGV